MATYEGKWRCLRCETANLGRHLNCLTCGVKRDDDVEFFLENDAKVVSDALLLNQANAGADWICQYCAGNNRALWQQCSSCGNARSVEDKQLVEETRGVGEWSEAAQKAETAQAANHANFQSVKSKQTRGSWLKFVLLGAGGIGTCFVALFAVLIYLSTLTYPVDVRVTGLEWERKIAIEEFKTVRETAWEGELPASARVESQTRAVHHVDKIPSGTRSVPETYTEQVADGKEKYKCGTKNKKNGYFEDVYCERTIYKSVTKTRTRNETVYRDVPVLRTRYTYSIDKWVAAGEKTTSGKDFNPVWATVTVDNVRTRESGRTETYTLIVQNQSGEQKTLRHKLTADNWKQFQNGMNLHGKLGFFGNLISIDELPNGEW